MLVSAKQRRPRHIALAFPIALAHLNAAVRGITDYARRHGNWIFTTSAETVTFPIESLRRWHGDGVIALLTTRAEAEAARRLRIPVVTFAGALRDPGVPRVRVDNLAIGRLAAEHLLLCGFRRFGFYGLRRVAYAADRGDAFIASVAKAGRRCSMRLAPSTFGRGRPWQDEMENLQRWLKRLKPPVGIFAVNDQRARLIIDACNPLGLRVPDDVAVIGVDNNRVICDFSDPTLSSIICDWQRVGYEMAALLDRILAGEPPPRRDILIPPLGIAKRASTRITVVDDLRIAAAIDYIDTHLAEVFGVERLLHVAQMPRRSFEEAFKKSLGVSPYRYLCAQRVARARELLAQLPPLKLGQIAARCGFLDLRRFRLVFTRFEGLSPAQYRRRLLASEPVPDDEG